MNVALPTVLPSPAPLALLPNIPLDIIHKAAWLPPTTVRIPARDGAIVTRLVVSLGTDANLRIQHQVPLDEAPIRAALRYVLAADRHLSALTIRTRSSGHRR